MCYWGRGKEEFKHSFALKLALILQKIMRSLGWLVFFKRWVYEFCAYLCNSHFSVKSEVASSTSVQRSTLFPPSFLNITNNVTVFFPTCSQIHSQHWKRPSPPGSANRCYPASHRRRIPICLAHWPAIPFGSCPFTLNCRAAKKAGLYEEQVHFFLFLISNQRYLKPQNAQCSRLLVTTLHPPANALAAENCSISPPHNSTCQGKVLGIVLQEGQWPNCKTCATPSRAPHLEEPQPRSPLSYLLISCSHLI